MDPGWGTQSDSEKTLPVMCGGLRCTHITQLRFTTFPMLTSVSLRDDVGEPAGWASGADFNAKDTCYPGIFLTICLSLQP